MMTSKKAIILLTDVMCNLQCYKQQCLSMLSPLQSLDTFSSTYQWLLSMELALIATYSRKGRCSNYLASTQICRCLGRNENLAQKSSEMMHNYIYVPADPVKNMLFPWLTTISNIRSCSGESLGVEWELIVTIEPAYENDEGSILGDPADGEDDGDGYVLLLLDAGSYKVVGV